MPGAVVVDLAGDLDWSEFDIPGGTLPARIVTLHVERPSRARSLLVLFPDGFRRDVVGSYECAEELVVLDGGLEMSGETYRQNDWAWIPAGVSRKSTTARPSMLALARFDGPARWVERVTSPPEEPTLHEPLDDRPRLLRIGSHTSAWLPAPPSGTASADTELLALEARIWARVPAGAAFPALDGACFCRTFEARGVRS